MIRTIQRLARPRRGRVPSRRYGRRRNGRGRLAQGRRRPDRPRGHQAAAAPALHVTTLAQPTVANLQALGRCEIDGRLAALARLQAAVDASAALTDAHEAALDSILSSTVARLRALRTEIDGDTTVEAVREDIRRIYVESGVYALVARQVGLVIAADRAAVAAPPPERGRRPAGGGDQPGRVKRE